MRLLGAKEFLKTVKPGTLFVELWFQNEQKCYEVIKKFESHLPLKDILNGSNDYHIYGDNSASLRFLKPHSDEETINIDGVDYDYLFYYDKNIVGDASPKTTLNLVFDTEEELPDKIEVEQTGKEFDCEEEFVTKEDIKRIIKWFIETEGPFRDESKEGWALRTLETTNCYKDNDIVNYKGEWK